MLLSYRKNIGLFTLIPGFQRYPFAKDNITTSSSINGEGQVSKNHSVSHGELAKRGI